jgi:hypothetical protein
VGVSFRNTVKSLFLIPATAMYKVRIIYCIKVKFSNGAVSIEAIEQLNTRYSHNFSTRIGKYVSAIKSN